MKKALKIDKYLLPGTDVYNFDFSLLNSLKKESPHYEKGRKTEALYTDDRGVVVKKVFSDVIEQGVLKALKINFYWYNEDDTVGLEKQQVVKNYNSSEAKTEQKKRRGRAIDYLEARADEKGQGFLIRILTHKFKNELDYFIMSGTDEFKNALEGELNNPDSIEIDLGGGVVRTLAQLLASKLPPTEKYPDGETVLHGILEEIM